ncbi:hypothetical protein [Actinomadura rayongensis]|uniref:Uncharacterized protein n=1 Tax=Actinomadura rayongensis TaxID=1429076 RepID=A0A6I4W1G8_9ACTN|nr:hypothetical protein [Actinomadura rayongensis]MXQ63138.1 hypothetical protein [Actinomadura rayongensis]
MAPLVEPGASEIDGLNALRSVIVERYRSLRCRLVEPGGSPGAFLRVVNPVCGQLAEDVRCRPAEPGDTKLVFVWSWGDVISPADDPVEAASAVARVLSPEV